MKTMIRAVLTLLLISVLPAAKAEAQYYVLIAGGGGMNSGSTYLSAYTSWLPQVIAKNTIGSISHVLPEVVGDIVIYNLPQGSTLYKVDFSGGAYGSLYAGLNTKTYQVLGASKKGVLYNSPIFPQGVEWTSPTLQVGDSFTMHPGTTASDARTTIVN